MTEILNSPDEVDIMSRHSQQAKKQKQDVVPATAKVVTQATTVEEYALEILQAFELEVQTAKERQKGQSLPYKDIIEAVDVVFDTVQSDKSPIALMADKVDKILTFRYDHMSDAHNTIAARIGNRVVEMEACQLKALRKEQLKHMQGAKTDNLYRRIYGLGYRKEFKRFDLVDGSLHRLSKPVKEEDQEEPTS
jgi:PHP family Zn ribbon phosphoesterase